MGVTSIRFFTAAPRKKPALGDRRATKKHGEQIRLPVVHNGMYVVSNGRQLYEWVSLETAEKRGYAYLIARTTPKQAGEVKP